MFISLNSKKLLGVDGWWKCGWWSLVELGWKSEWWIEMENETDGD